MNQSIPESGQAEAQVSEYSREVARRSVPDQVDRLLQERTDLSLEKRKIEERLAEVTDYKLSQTKRILGQQTPVGERVRLTASLECEVRERRKPILKDLYGVEERINDVSARLKTKKVQPLPSPQKFEQLETLLRIEKLLTRMLAVMENKKGDR